MKTVVLGGQRADVVVTPADSGASSKTLAGNSKQDILDMVSGATPSVVTLPSLGSAPEKAVR